MKQARGIFGVDATDNQVHKNTEIRRKKLMMALILSLVCEMKCVLGLFKAQFAPYARVSLGQSQIAEAYRWPSLVSWSPS